jgi:hypothetical protein
VVGLVLTSSVLASLIGNALERNSSRLDRVRDQYASATRALAAWNQFPVRIQRRVDDEPETRRRISEYGSDISEQLSYYSGWTRAENVVMGDLYLDLVTKLRVDVAVHARHAWTQAPRTSAAAMVLVPSAIVIDSSPPGWSYIQQFSVAVEYRFGWRRNVLPERLLRRVVERRLGRSIDRVSRTEIQGIRTSELEQGNMYLDGDETPGAGPQT